MKTPIFPILKSDRLILRETTKLDADQIYFLRSDSEVNKFIERPEDCKTKSLSDALNFIDKIAREYDQVQSISWCICVAESDQMIGSICLWNYSNDMKTAELGYALHPCYQGKGIMNEALLLVVNYGFKACDFEMIEAYTHSDNVRSKALLRNNGFMLNIRKKDDDDPANEVYELFK